MQGRKAKGAQMPGHPNCRAFGGSTESAQGGLGRPLGAEAVSLAELVPGSRERLQLGQGSAVSVPPDASELGGGWPHAPAHMPLKENHGDSGLGWLVGGGEVGSPLLPWDCSFPLGFFTCFPAAHLTRVPGTKKQPQSCQRKVRG